MEDKTIDELFDDYKMARKMAITKDQFVSFVAFFPTLMIVYNDGRIDEDESDYLNELARSLAESFRDDGLSSDKINSLKHAFSEEFQYLLKNFKQWENKFINTLKVYLKENPQEKGLVLETMNLFAEASHDTGLDEKIVSISKSLAL